MLPGVGGVGGVCGVGGWGGVGGVGILHNRCAGGAGELVIQTPGVGVGARSSSGDECRVVDWFEIGSD